MRTSDPDGSAGRGAPLHRLRGAGSRVGAGRVTHGELPADLAAQGLAGAGTVFRNRGFVLLWTAQALSQLASNMVLAALMAVVFRATGSNTAIPLLLATSDANAVYVVVAVMFGLAAAAIVPLPAVLPATHQELGTTEASRAL